MKIRHPQATQVAEAPCCFTDLRLAVTSAPWAVLRCPREAQGQGKSPSEPAGTGGLQHWGGAQPRPHAALPSPWGRASTLQHPPTAQLQDATGLPPPQNDLAAASPKRQLGGGHVLSIPNKHTLYISEVKDFIIP